MKNAALVLIAFAVSATPLAIAGNENVIELQNAFGNSVLVEVRDGRHQGCENASNLMSKVLAPNEKLPLNCTGEPGYCFRYRDTRNNFWERIRGLACPVTRASMLQTSGRIVLAPEDSKSGLDGYRF